MLFSALSRTNSRPRLGFLPSPFIVIRRASVRFAVPIWASVGAAAIAMLVLSGALPLSLVGESLFDGIDAFALDRRSALYSNGGCACSLRAQSKIPERRRSPDMLDQGWISALRRSSCAACSPRSRGPMLRVPRPLGA